MKKKPSRIVLDWLKRADSDLGFAKAAYKDFDDFYSQMCILCHDAVEKYFKAYVVSKKRRYKRIHDLVTLINDCALISDQPERFIEIRKECKVLNNYYTPLKYPSHFPFATKKQAKEAIRIAEEIAQLIKEQIL